MPIPFASTVIVQKYTLKRIKDFKNNIFFNGLLLTYIMNTLKRSLQLIQALNPYLNIQLAFPY